MSLIKQSEEYLTKTINELGYEIENVKLEKSGKPEFGQFQVNVAMMIAKKYGVNPREVATKITEAFDSRFTNVNIQGPGFINVSFPDEYLMEYLNAGITDFNIHIDSDEDKTIIIDYGGANAAKSLHIGHMRAANIGEALKRLAGRFTTNIIGDVHLGDIGRQAGMLITEYQSMHPDSPFFDPNFEGTYPQIELTAADLGVMYPTASLKAKEDEELMERVRDIAAKIDCGDKALTELWKQMVKISSVSIKEVYDKLNCTFDLWEGELDAMQYVPEVLKIMEPYMHESEGAQVMDVVEETDTKEIPPLMVIKSNGATNYQTRELGTLYSRIERFKPNEIWYVVDARQAMHFVQVFRGSYKSGLVPESTKLEHLAFGTINGPDGKPFKTRDGGVMELNSLIKLVHDTIEPKIKETITGDERENVANSLTIATIKYADLSPYRKTDYIFDVDKFASFEGKTGIYAVYTTTRIKSLLAKLSDSTETITTIPNEDVRNILVKLTELSRTLTVSYNERVTSYICDFIYELCSLFNKFYSNNNIQNEENEENKKSFIAVSRLVYNTLSNLLNILAIDEVEKM